MSEPPRASGAPQGPGARRELSEIVWDFFVSVRLSLWLIGLVAAACVLGTFTSPNPVPAEEIRRGFGDGLGARLILAFELNDLFHSWWFTLLLLLLALNLLACSVERLPRIVQVALRPERRLNDEIVSALKSQARLPAKGPIEEEARRVAQAFAAAGLRPAWVEVEGGTAHVFAERGRLSRFGVHVTHLALLIVLAGGIVGRLLGAEGHLNVPEGGGSFAAVPVSAAAGTSTEKPLGFTVRVDDFRLLTFADGRPRSYESDLVVLEDGVEVKRQKIAVNHPLRHRGWTIYQSSYLAVPERGSARLEIRDRQTGGSRTETVQPGGSVAVADGVRFEVLGFEADVAGSGPAVRIARVEGEQRQSFWVFQRHPGFDLANRPDRWGIDYLSQEPFYLTGLQVARDPGAGIVFAGCIVLFLGLMQAFYLSHRRVWAKIDSGEILLAGSAHKGQEAFARMFAGLVRALGGTGP